MIPSLDGQTTSALLRKPLPYPKESLKPLFELLLKAVLPSCDFLTCSDSKAVLVGTSASQIIEISGKTSKILASGHSGIPVNETSQTFSRRRTLGTCGSSKQGPICDSQ